MNSSRILLGVIGRPHGVRGLVHVHSYTAEPSDLALYAPLYDDQGRSWSLVWRSEGVAELRDSRGAPLTDRSMAERLVNTRLHVDRERLPPPDGEEFYLADLVGLAAYDAAGVLVGSVVEIHDYGAGTSLEIVREGKAALLVPFTKAAVPDIDIPAGRLTVSPPDEIDMREVAA
jgi:16S rRNA processing protein RimM